MGNYAHATPHALAEKIKRLDATEIAQLAQLLAEDHMADKLVPAFEAEIMDRDFKHKQQDLTELNADGNRERGRYGEDGR